MSKKIPSITLLKNKTEARRQIKNLVEYCLEDKEEVNPKLTQLIDRLLLEFRP